MSMPWGTDPETMFDYIRARSPDELLREFIDNGYTPTAILTGGDMLLTWGASEVFRGAWDKHAIALYTAGLRMLAEDPSREELDTNVGGAHVQLAVAYMRTKQPQRALEALKVAQALGTNDADVKFKIAQCHGMLGRHADALAAIQDIEGRPREQIAQELTPSQLETIGKMKTYSVNALRSGGPARDSKLWIEDIWARAEERFNVGDLAGAASLHRRAIDFLHEIERMNPTDSQVRQYLGTDYMALGRCLLGDGDEIEVNAAVHCLLTAISYGERDPSLRQNLLHCIAKVNFFMKSGFRLLADTKENRDAEMWQNNGYRWLKKPYPEGTPGRNWADAAHCYMAAVKLAPLAPSFHGLGLAYEGLGRDDEAIAAWRKVKELEPQYDFGVRYQYTTDPNHFAVR